MTITRTEASVLTRAMLRASSVLGMDTNELASAIGVSQRTLGRYARNTSALRDGTKQWELAILLVQVYRFASALVGDDPVLLKAWAGSYNRALNTSPKNAMLTAQGLVAAYIYVHQGPASCLISGDELTGPDSYLRCS